MERGRRLSQWGAGPQQLPIVSIFLVLLCMLAALNSYARPSDGRFESIQASLKLVFAPKQISAEPKKAEISKAAATQVADICARYGAVCRAVETKQAKGTLIEVLDLHFKAQGGDLPDAADRFLQDVSGLAKMYSLSIHMSLPSDVDLAGADIGILSALIARYRGKPAAILQAPGLLKSDFGLAIMPGHAS